VTVPEDSSGDKRLVAYLVAENAPAGLLGELQALARSRLPEYMVPAHFVSLPALPLTPNGKIDRKALPAPQHPGLALQSGSYVAPESDFEISLATAWQKVLGVPRVGITDNFFELGGNSLSVLKLIFEMKQASGVDIPLGDVFRYPTIASLIAHLAPETAREASFVVPLQAEGDGVPVFCICGLEIYREFAHSLAKNQPVYGVYVEEEQAIIGQVLRGETASISVDRLVAAYHSAISRFRPKGPYRLGGVSFGGVLAMELASRLRKLGEQVDIVFLFDTILPTGQRRSWPKWLRRQLVELARGQGGGKLRRLLERLHGHRAGRTGVKSYIVDDGFADRRGAAFFQASGQLRVTDLVADFPVVLFQASDRSAWGPDVQLDPDYGWRRHVGERLQIVQVAGGHLGIIQPPNVADLGRRAQGYLEPLQHGDSVCQSR
jgi:thioesterase domain-containing protein/acyl carrier protein